MDSGVVEFHALTNPNGTGAEDNDLFAVRNHRFILGFIGGIEIGDIAVKFRSAGVNHPITGNDALLLPKQEDFLLAGTPNVGNGPVREAHLLGGKQGRGITVMLLEKTFHADNIANLSQEEMIDSGGIRNLVHICTQTH